MKQAKWYPSPTTRNKLLLWEPGVEKDTWTAHVWLGWGTRYSTLTKLAQHGYLESCELAITWGNGQVSKRAGYRRTTKMPPAYKERGPLKKPPKPRTYNGPFPWSSAAKHLRAIQLSPARIQTTVAGKLGAPARHRHRWLMTTESELTRFRRMALNVFQENERQYVPWPDPELLRMQLLEALIEPEYDEDGRFLRFREMDGEEARDEYDQIVQVREERKGWPLVRTYRGYMKTRKLSVRPTREPVAAP